MARWVFLAGLLFLVWASLRRTIRAVASGQARAPLWYLLLASLIGQEQFVPGSRPNSLRQPTSRRAEPLPVGRLVRCVACGFYFPESRAVASSFGGACCSPGCAAAPARPPATSP
jgi:hypothetical protein